MTIYFGTPSDSQKARNIARSSKVSLTINRDYKTWADIAGVSVGGIATLVTDAAQQAKIGQLLFGKFPQIQDYAPAAETTQDVTFIRIDPEVISLLDYSKESGHTELFEV